MKKIVLVSSIFIILVGCARKDGTENGQKEEGYKQEIKELKKENESLVDKINLYENSQENRDEQETETDPKLEKLARDFLASEFTYTNPKERADNMKQYITEEFSSMILNEAVYSDEASSVTATSKIEQIDIYRTKKEDVGSSILVRVETSFTVGNEESNRLDMFVELKTSRENGAEKISAQEIHPIT